MVSISISQQVSHVLLHPRRQQPATGEHTVSQVSTSNPATAGFFGNLGRNIQLGKANGFKVREFFCRSLFVSPEACELYRDGVMLPTDRTIRQVCTGSFCEHRTADSGLSHRHHEQMSTSSSCTEVENAMLRCMPAQTGFLTYKPDCVFPWVSVLDTLSKHRKRAGSSAYQSYGRLPLKSSSISVIMRACTLTCLCYQTLQLSSKQRFPFQMAHCTPGYQRTLSRKPLMQYSIY